MFRGECRSVEYRLTNMHVSETVRKWKSVREKEREGSFDGRDLRLSSPSRALNSDELRISSNSTERWAIIVKAHRWYNQTKDYYLCNVHGIWSRVRTSYLPRSWVGPRDNDSCLWAAVFLEWPQREATGRFRIRSVGRADWNGGGEKRRGGGDEFMGCDIIDGICHQRCDSLRASNGPTEWTNR